MEKTGAAGAGGRAAQTHARAIGIAEARRENINSSATRSLRVWTCRHGGGLEH